LGCALGADCDERLIRPDERKTRPDERLKFVMMDFLVLMSEKSILMSD